MHLHTPQCMKEWWHCTWLWPKHMKLIMDVIWFRTWTDALGKEVWMSVWIIVEDLYMLSCEWMPHSDVVGKFKKRRVKERKGKKTHNQMPKSAWCLSHDQLWVGHPNKTACLYMLNWWCIHPMHNASWPSWCLDCTNYKEQVYWPHQSWLHGEQPVAINTRIVAFHCSSSVCYLKNSPSPPPETWNTSFPVCCSTNDCGVIYMWLLFRI